MILAIYGTGGMGKDAYQIVKDYPSIPWEKILFIDDTREEGMEQDCEMMVFETFARRYSPEEAVIHVGMGESINRQKVTDKVKALGYKIVSIIHPHAQIAEGVTIGEGSQIKMGVVVGSHSVIGNGCVLQSYSTVGTGVTLGNYVQISAKCHISDNVTMEDNAFVGMHGCVSEGVHMGKFSIVSMGAVLFRDLPDDSICMGNPGRVMATNTTHRVYH